MSRPTKSNLVRLASALQLRPEIKLRVFANEGIDDLGFLKHFAFIRSLTIELWQLGSLSGIEAVESLDSLTIGRTKTRALSLRPLHRFVGLKELYIEAYHKDIEVIAELTHVEELTLRSVTLPNLKWLQRIPRLNRLDIELGGASNLADVASLKELRHLELWQIRGISDLSWLGELARFRSLFLQGLTHVTSLPSLYRLECLRGIYLEAMTGLLELPPNFRSGRLS